MNEATYSTRLDQLKVALLPFSRLELSGADICNLMLGALDQHVKDLPDAKKTAALLRAYAKHIVERRS